MGLTDAELLWEPVDPCWTVRTTGNGWEADLHATRELTHHGAEVALLRDLHGLSPGSADTGGMRHRPSR